MKPPTPVTSVVLLAGGFGGARMAHGFSLVGEPVELTVIGNTADDLELHGLHISPDLDTVMYTLAGLANEETGWGVKDETWSAAGMLETYGQPTWFGLGDRDLATHIVRTAGLREGERLTTVTADLNRALGVAATVLPMSDDEVRTRIRTKDGWLDFQEYFVRNRHADEVLEVRFDGLGAARPTREVLDAIESAALIVLAPSNPFLSVAPILALPDVLDALHAAAAQIVAVSPIVSGGAVRGPAAAIMRSLGTAPGAAGIAEHYATGYPGLLDLLFLDTADSDECEAVRGHGITPVMADIVIPDDSRRRQLAREILLRCGPATD